MDCNKCRYHYINDNGLYGTDMCDIAHVCNPKFCGLTSDKDVIKMDICYNCEYWIGGGDWGLSCEVDYYNCSANGFDEACEKFKNKERKV